MIGRFSFVAIALATLVAAGSLDPGAARQVQAANHYNTEAELFHNYYVPPGNYGGVPAQLYLSPVPTPPVVGHTYVTYQPLLPHEFLYPHCRKYWRYNSSNDRWTRTQVVWQRTWFGLDYLPCPW